MDLLAEVIAFSRELLKVAPARLQPHCYGLSTFALMALQKLDEAEDLLHEGLAVCGQAGMRTYEVSGDASFTSSSKRVKALPS
jgi:hypothetical protein